MSTNLQLVNSLASESAVSGSASTVATVVGQTGMSLRLVNWIKQAHTEIQNKYTYWRWMRSTWSVPTVAGTETYAYGACTDTVASAVITRFKRWWPVDADGASNISRYLTSGGVAGQMWMTFLPWSHFRALYKFGSMQNNQAPIVHVTIDPYNQLMFGPKPDAIYTVLGEYQKSALVFSADSDTPEFPSNFHDLVMFRALEKYARFAAAPEALAHAQTEGDRLMRQLEQDQLPPLTLGAPLA